MRLVSNASPLIFLAKTELLSLLRNCFSQVLVPPAVVAETGLDLPDFIACTELSEAGHAFVRGAIGTLHHGEVETIVLAREQGIDLVAIDDKAARSIHGPDQTLNTTINNGHHRDSRCPRVGRL